MVTLVLPGHPRELVTVFPTGTDLILVTLVLTMASSVPGDTGSPGPHLYLVTLILSMASPDLVTVVPIGISPGPLSLVPTWVTSGYCYTVH